MNLMGTVKMREKCKEGRDALIMTSMAPLLLQETLLSGSSRFPTSAPQHSGWGDCRWQGGGGRAVLCIEGMFGNIPGLPPLDADYTPPPVATKRKYSQALLDVSLTPGLTYYNNREEKEHTQRCEETQTLCRNLTAPKSQWNNFQSSLTFIFIQGACVARAHVGRTFPIGIYFKSDAQSQL